MPEPTTTGASAAPAVSSEALAALVASVLHVPVEKVVPDADLVMDLGAESIDFLDLVFGLDAIVGRHVLPEQWSAFVKERVPALSSGRGITLALLEEFATTQAHAG